MRERSTSPKDKPRAGTRSTREDSFPEDKEGSLKGPHERDESAGSMEAGTDQESGQRAYDDLAAGRIDTDLRGRAQEIIDRAQHEDTDAQRKHEGAEGKPARGETTPTARPAPDPAKE